MDGTPADVLRIHTAQLKHGVNSGFVQAGHRTQHAGDQVQLILDDEFRRTMLCTAGIASRTATGGRFQRPLPKSSIPPTVGTLRPWCFIISRSVSRSTRLSLRTDANDSEAARKSSASESHSGIACSSRVSARAKRRSSSITSQSARRLVEPTRT